MLCRLQSEAVVRRYSVKNVFLKISQNTGLKPATLLKKRLWHRCFPVNFVIFLRTPFFIEHLWWLLLSSSSYSTIEIDRSIKINRIMKLKLSYLNLKFCPLNVKIFN